ncbi:MAG: ribbon-helix-helix protein, CopG family [Actinomycetota bacterium]|nr:ribbon-helix-helix protein, CopG family [Actinomycetota bacterium]
MRRTQILLTDQQRQVLDAEAARSGRSMAELIRAAIDVVYGAGDKVADDLEGIAAAEASRARTDHGGAQVDQMRSGSRRPMA